MTARIGIYSGTFDPVHAGHIAFALATLRTCKLDKVVFLPEAQPRNKQDVTTISHRVTLLEAALANTSSLEVIRLLHPTFTVRHVLPQLRILFTGAELTLLVGSDVARSLPYWPDSDELLSEMSLAIGMRAGDTEEAVRQLVASNDITFIRTDFSGLTSSQVRNGKAAHLSETAAEYVRKNALYT